MPGGWRDGNVSVAQETSGNLPPPTASVKQLNQIDLRRQGGQTVGHGRPLGGAHDWDVAVQLLQHPALRVRAQRRRRAGPQLRTGGQMVPLDPVTPTAAFDFDTNYYAAIISSPTAACSAPTKRCC